MIVYTHTHTYSRSLARSFCSSARSLGVKVESTRAGDGKTFPRPGDTVHMHYTGRLQSTGKVFDSSVERGEPFVTRIGVGQVIRAWDEAVPELSLGQKVSGQRGVKRVSESVMGGN